MKKLWIGRIDPQNYHMWEVETLTGVNSRTIRQFVPEEYDTPMKQYDALMEYLSALDSAGTEYCVYCDGFRATEP